MGLVLNRSHVMISALISLQGCCMEVSGAVLLHMAESGHTSHQGMACGSRMPACPKVLRLYMKLYILPVSFSKVWHGLASGRTLHVST